MRDIQQFVKYGLDRDIPELLWPPTEVINDETGEEALDGLSLNLGPGNTKVITTPFGEMSYPMGPGSQHWFDEMAMDGVVISIPDKLLDMERLPAYEPNGESLWRAEDWRAEDGMPFKDETVAEIHAYQFFEHLDGETAVGLLRECERVLVPRGVLNIVTPYANSQHQFQALDHKSFWTEETWHWLFGEHNYDDHQSQPWKLKVHACFILGVVYRNLDLFTQLVKPG